MPLYVVPSIRDPLARLDTLAQAANDIHGLIADAVREARARGDSWQSIGDGLGITRAAAWERFHDPN